MKEIRDAPEGDPLTKVTEKVLNSAQIHSSNIPGTPAYWRSTYHEMQATDFYFSYIEGEETNAFATGSLAEYHEYNLRLLLSKYTSKLSGVDPNLPQLILSDDAYFAKAVQSYKNVVTHYLASKMEIWMALFLKPVYGVESGQLSNEFAKMRGVIHFHSALRIMSDAIKASQRALKEFALALSEQMENVNEFIMENYDPHLHGDDFPINPALVNTKDGAAVREKFCMLSDRGKYEWKIYSLQKGIHEKNFNEKIGEIFESEFGIHALHIGNFPEDWVKPGGLPNDNYRVTSTGMQSSADVIDRQELKKPKFHREHNLFERRVNITNHAGTHKCSGYCLKCKKLSQRYDPERHADVKDQDKFLIDGVEMVKVTCEDCRFGFGQKLAYDHSGENNFTRGIPPIREPYAEPDKNGQLRFFGRRNHPRTVQEPHGFPYYNANNDFQFMLINATGRETLEEIGPEKYEKFTNNLVAAGYAGLEHHNGAHVLSCYLTKYKTKVSLFIGSASPFLLIVMALFTFYCRIMLIYF